MKKIFLLLFKLTMMLQLTAQNVGIGTTAPTEKLQVVDGNIGIAFANYFVLKGGLNYSGFNDPQTLANLNPGMGTLNAGIGYQGGLGVQFTQNFGVDIGFVQMQQSNRAVTVKQAGTEIGFHATF